MLKSMLALFLFNGFAGISLAVFAQYLASYVARSSRQEKNIEYLQNKICQLEKQVHDLQQSLEEMEERVLKKDNALLESNHQLQNKLEDFINYNYEILE
jgi:flagellar capping protein FliD